MRFIKTNIQKWSSKKLLFISALSLLGCFAFGGIASATPNNYPASYTYSGDTGNAFGGGANIVNESGNFWLYCDGGGGHVIEKEHSGGCDTNLSSTSQYYSQWAQRPNGQIGQTDTYVVIAPESTITGAQNSITVILNHGCNPVKDSYGWEDHVDGDPTTWQPGYRGVGDVSATVTNGQTFLCQGSSQLGNDNNGNDLLVSIPTTGGSNGIGAFQSAADQFGYVGGDPSNPYVKAVIQIKVDADPQFNLSGVAKVFTLSAPAGIYVGPAGGNDIGLKDPQADYSFKTADVCQTGPQSFNTQWCPQYSGLNRTTNNQDSFLFQFTPDCSYQSSDSNQLKWYNANDSTQTNGKESWTLTDTTTGQQIAAQTPNGNGGYTPTAGWVVGHYYVWQWNGVDRSHGLYAQLPFTEFGASLSGGLKCSWNLLGQSKVDANSVATKKGDSGVQTVHFDHQITNAGGSASANYHWWVQGSYNGGSWTNFCGDGQNNGTDKCPSPGCLPINSWGGSQPNNCSNESSVNVTVSPGGHNPAFGGAAEVAYQFPSTAKNGDKYCERISFNNSEGPGTANASSSSVCVTYNRTTPPPPPPPQGGCYEYKGTAPGYTPVGAYGQDGQYVESTSGSAYSMVYVGSTGVPYQIDVHNRAGASQLYDPGPSSLSYAGVNPGNYDFTYYPKGTGVSYAQADYVYANFPAVTYPNGTYTYVTKPDGTIVPYPNYSTQPAFSEIVAVGVENAGFTSCYSASCSITSVDEGPNGYVQEGGQYTANVTLTNTGPQPLWNQLYFLYDGPVLGVWSSNGYTSDGGTDNYLSNLTGGSYPDYPYGLPPGYSAYFQVTFNSTNTGKPHYETPTILPSYLGGDGFALSSPCSGPPVDVYEPFNLSANAGASLNPDGENPTSLSYFTQINNSTNVDVNAQSTSTAWKNPAGSGVQLPLPGSPAFASPPAIPAGGAYYPINQNQSPVPYPPVEAGDQYCAEISTAYTQGLVGAGGPGDLQDTNTPYDSGPHCNHIYNEPYFKAHGKGVSAGGEFTNLSSACSVGGELAGYNDNNSVTTGAGTQIGALALKPIFGFASGQNGNNSGTGAARLSFANTGPGIAVQPGKPSPSLGGQYGSCGSLNPVLPPNYATPDSSNAVSINALDSQMHGNTQASRTYGYNADGTKSSTPVNLQIQGNSQQPVISAGHNISIFVNGNVYIHSNIQYDTGALWNSTNVPSFVLVATGNIYIDPGVTELDGLYVAEKSSLNSTDGKIYTCADPNNHFAPDSATYLYDDCGNQLIVYGTFEADQINLMRTFGSLRDSQNRASEAPVEYGTAAPTLCSNGSIASTCAAEVFDFSPEMYMSSPAVSSPNGGALQYDAITSLPPIF